MNQHYNGDERTQNGADRRKRGWDVDGVCQTFTGEPPPCDPHQWIATGRREPHVNIPPWNLPVDYVRCAVCRQNGFRRSWARNALTGLTSRVVFTWSN